MSQAWVQTENYGYIRCDAITEISTWASPIGGDMSVSVESNGKNRTIARWSIGDSQLSQAELLEQAAQMARGFVMTYHKEETSTYRHSFITFANELWHVANS